MLPYLRIVRNINCNKGKNLLSKEFNFYLKNCNFLKPDYYYRLNGGV